MINLGPNPIWQADTPLRDRSCPPQPCCCLPLMKSGWHPTQPACHQGHRRTSLPLYWGHHDLSRHTGRPFAKARGDFKVPVKTLPSFLNLVTEMFSLFWSMNSYHRISAFLFFVPANAYSTGLMFLGQHTLYFALDKSISKKKKNALCMVGWTTVITVWIVLLLYR